MWRKLGWISPEPTFLCLFYCLRCHHRSWLQIWRRLVKLEVVKMVDPTDANQVSQEYLDEYIGDRLLIIASLFIGLNTIFIILYYVSRYMAKTLDGWDTFFLIPAGYLFNLGLCVCSIRKCTISVLHFVNSPQRAQPREKRKGLSNASRSCRQDGWCWLPRPKSTNG